jgi:hypothetical protein
MTEAAMATAPVTAPVAVFVTLRMTRLAIDGFADALFSVLAGWVRNLIGFYEARDIIEFGKFPNVEAWLNRVLERPAVQKGLTISARG